MPSKMRPDDWDRLFAPNAPRRGGPLRVLGNIIIAVLVVVLLSGGIYLIITQRNQQIAAANLQATALAPTIAADQTATAQMEAAVDATRVALRTATVLAQTPVAEPTEVGIGGGTITRGGNLRSEPRIADDTVIGLLWTGDQVDFLEQREVGGQIWYRVRLTQPAANRGEGVPAGTVGWISSLLVSPS